MPARQVTIFVISEEGAGFETGVEVLLLGSWDFLADSPTSPQVEHLVVIFPSHPPVHHLWRLIQPVPRFW